MCIYIKACIWEKIPIFLGEDELDEGLNIKEQFEREEISSEAIQNFMAFLIYWTK